MCSIKPLPATSKLLDAECENGRRLVIGSAQDVRLLRDLLPRHMSVYMTGMMVVLVVVLFVLMLGFSLCPSGLPHLLPLISFPIYSSPCFPLPTPPSPLYSSPFFPLPTPP